MAKTRTTFINGQLGATAQSSHVDDAASPSLRLDQDVDVCVVGGGLAGLTTALEIARHGVRVVLLEAGRVGAGASAYQLGSVAPGYELGLHGLVERVGEVRAREFWELSRDGAIYMRGLIADAMPDGVSLSEGALTAFATDRDDVVVQEQEMLARIGGITTERWSRERFRDTIRTPHYFAGLYSPDAFQLNARAYLMALAHAVRKAGVRIYEDTPAVAIDPDGIRKRVFTRHARVRASHVILAGGVHLGEPMTALSETLLPVWRHAAISAPIPDLAKVIAFSGTVFSHDQRDQYRIIEGNRLFWCGPRSAWQSSERRQIAKIRRRAGQVFPELKSVEWTDFVSAPVGHTVQQMPQIGQIQHGLWVATGFGEMGLANASMAAGVITRGIFDRDDRWRMFAEFDLVWAAGRTGRVVSEVIHRWEEGATALAASLARYREKAAARDEIRRAEKARRTAAAQAREDAIRSQVEAASRAAERTDA